MALAYIAANITLSLALTGLLLGPCGNFQLRSGQKRLESGVLIEMMWFLGIHARCGIIKGDRQ